MEPSPRRVDLIPVKRRALILEWFRRHGAASIGELAAGIGASGSTIRRDLEHLTEAGYLERTHGGAVLATPTHATFELDASINAEMFAAQKRAIGREAAALLQARDSVIFDSSSTVLEAARAALAREIELTAVTNDLDIARLCGGERRMRVVVPGGSVRPGTSTLVGNPGETFLKGVHADLCLIGTQAITGGDLTDASIEIVSAKRAMLAAARRTILLADSSKFHAPAFCTFCRLGEIDEIITDSGIAREHRAGLAKFGLTVTVVAVDDGT
ncbi:DeoR/GlpR family DNA-binding transcription regulator [Aureimonas pseudogalii]|uniref:DeoR/GlpR family transcriptional regulator of sugar metabolism n=1 Tax=Aureimonas pseudogalii TaxID=1744844 RepID=A0A7W6EAQ8_9HYPH|nr:DeoR/GlpR family DNA-binding transcription regulator [Aureimonas pseudogalii]MBB3997867.1 DeoR/GlpR family transcriptional regulator of sugar metabolism [Aureimonas pseudogalii]